MRETVDIMQADGANVADTNEERTQIKCCTIQKKLTKTVMYVSDTMEKDKKLGINSGTK